MGGEGQGAKERADIAVRGQAALQKRFGTPDLALAGQEDENTAFGLGYGLFDKSRSCLGQADVARERLVQVDGLDRIGAPLGDNHRRIAHEGSDRFGDKRGRHGEEDQIGPQRATDFEREGKAKVGIEAALVKLVEDHGANAGEFRVGLDHAGEDAFGDDLDARRL